MKGFKMMNDGVATLTTGIVQELLSPEDGGIVAENIVRHRIRDFCTACLTAEVEDMTKDIEQLKATIRNPHSDLIDQLTRLNTMQSHQITNHRQKIDKLVGNLLSISNILKVSLN